MCRQGQKRNVTKSRVLGIWEGAYCGGKTEILLGAEKSGHTWKVMNEVLGWFRILRTGRQDQPSRTFPLGSAVLCRIRRSQLRRSRNKKRALEMSQSSLRINTLLWGVKGIYLSVLRFFDRNVADDTAGKPLWITKPNLSSFPTFQLVFNLQ